MSKYLKKAIIPVLLILGVIMLVVVKFVFIPKIDNSNEIARQNEQFRADANKNGEIMHDSINTIEGIFDTVKENINSVTYEELKEYENTIKNANLSKEYDEYRTQALNKIAFAEQFASLKDKEIASVVTEYIDNYNAVDMNEYLSEAFDKAGVEYEYEDSKIKFKYYESK